VSAVATSLKTSRDNLLAKIQSVTADPKPSYKIDGQDVDHAGYLQSLLDALKKIEDALTALGEGSATSWEIESDIGIVRGNL
jgi:hypothetical protein